MGGGWVIILFVIMFLFPAHSYSGEFDLRITEQSGQADEDSFQTGQWERLQLFYSPNKSIYYFTSGERVAVFPNGYHAFDYVMYGFGAGKRLQLTKSIRMFSQIGVMKVVNSWGGRKRF